MNFQLNDRWSHAKEEFNFLSRVGITTEQSLSMKLLWPVIKPLGLAGAFAVAFATNRADAAESARNWKEMNALARLRLQTLEKLNKNRSPMGG